MDTETLAPQTTRRQTRKVSTMTKTKPTQLDSVFGAIPTRTHGVGIWGNRRVATGIRVDERLYKQAKPVLEAVFGSTCRGIETYLAALVATTEQQRLGGDIPNTTIRIENLHVERNIRSRRKLVVEEEREETVTEKVVLCHFCHRGPVAAQFQNLKTGNVVVVCGFHEEQLSDHPQWQLVEVEASP